MNFISFGDCREIMRIWAACGIKAQTCVTSPPYFGLRDYGVDGQLGLERTPEQYVAAMVEVFRGVRDMLTDDGTLWLNIGDSYANDGSSGGKHAKALHGQTSIGRTKTQTGLKPKDLIGIPWMLAFALRADGWYLRQDVIWHKPNPMPESVRDRCTKAHEYIFLLSKSERYFVDPEGLKEPAIEPRGPGNKRPLKSLPGERDGENANVRGSLHMIGPRETRNRRSVWTVATRPYKGAHFATFPPALIEPCILAGSHLGDIVLDPFMGSGTTAAVALQHGRKYLGCELNPEYEALQRQRLDKIVN